MSKFVIGDLVCANCVSDQIGIVIENSINHKEEYSVMWLSNTRIKHVDSEGYTSNSLKWAWWKPEDLHMVDSLKDRLIDKDLRKLVCVERYPDLE